jgi:2-oxo-3-hexenedioate decarboxylase
VAVGWKVALDIAEVEDALGSAPAFGYLTSATRLTPSGTFEGASAAGIHVECELAVRLQRDVQPDDSPGSVARSIGAVAVALEVVDESLERGDAHRVICANVLHRAFALGPPNPGGVPSGSRALGTVDGVVREVGAVTADVPERLAAVAALLDRQGERLRAGEWVLTGSLTHVEARPGTNAEVAIDGLGSLAVRIT